MGESIRDGLVAGTENWRLPLRGSKELRIERRREWMTVRRRSVHKWAKQQQIPVRRFAKGENKEAIARPLIEAAERDGGDGKRGADRMWQPSSRYPAICR